MKRVGICLIGFLMGGSILLAQLPTGVILGVAKDSSGTVVLGAGTTATSHMELALVAAREILRRIVARQSRQERHLAPQPCGTIPARSLSSRPDLSGPSGETF